MEENVRTLFCVQTFRRRGLVIEPHMLAQYESAVEAEEVGARLSRRADGVLVYAIDCDPEHDIWEEPEVFARHGLVPALVY